jgi:hypothetical protein
MNYSSLTGASGAGDLDFSETLSFSRVTAAVFEGLALAGVFQGLASAGVWVMLASTVSLKSLACGQELRQRQELMSSLTP